jgi:DUF1016 N-terminal domain
MGNSALTVQAKSAIFAAKPAVIIAKLTPTEKTAFLKLKKINDEKIEGDVVWYWHLGQETAKILSDAREHHESYGNAIVNRLSRALNYSSDKPLNNAMHIAQTWPTRTKLDEMLRMRGDGEQRLFFTHMSHLTSISDDSVRTQYAARTLAEGWTAERLGQEIQKVAKKTKMRDRKERGEEVGGRPTKLPSTVYNCLVHMKTQADKLTKLFTDAWMGEKFDLETAFSHMPPDKVSEELRAAIQEAREAMIVLQSNVQVAARMLANLDAEAEKRIIATTKATAKAEKDDAAAETNGDGDVNMADWKKQQAAANKPKKKKKRVGVGAH